MIMKSRLIAQNAVFRILSILKEVSIIALSPILTLLALKEISTFFLDEFLAALSS